MAHTISNSDSVVDSRDVIARIEELESELSAVPCSYCEGKGRHTNPMDEGEDIECKHCDGEGTVDLAGIIADPDHENTHTAPHADEYGDQMDELRTLRKVAEQGEGYGDWHHGETLIRDSYFEDYARELASDVFGADEKKGWPFDYIDWEAAADALKVDYMEIDWDGVTYYMRA